MIAEIKSETGDWLCRSVLVSLLKEAETALGKARRTRRSIWSTSSSFYWHCRGEEAALVKAVKAIKRKLRYNTSNSAMTAPDVITKDCDAAPASWLGADQLHLWWELSYAQYLTIPRSVMQSMPDAWQLEMARLLNELDDTIDWRPEGQYWVKLRDSRGKYVSDPLCDYERGRRRIAPKTKAPNSAISSEGGT